jgi:hypothetical protein
MANLTGTGLKALGLNNDISATDDYHASQAVSRVLHEEVPVIDGIIYVSRQVNTDLCVAMFERSAVMAAPQSPPLSAQPGFNSLRTMFRVTYVGAPGGT